MADERQYQALLAHLEQDLSGFIGASVVEVETGRTLAAHSVRPEFDLAEQSSSSAEMLRLQHRALLSSQASTRVHDLIVMLSDRVFLSHMLSSETMLYLAAEHTADQIPLMRLAALKAAVSRRVAQPNGSLATAHSAPFSR